MNCLGVKAGPKASGAAPEPLVGWSGLCPDASAGLFYADTAPGTARRICRIATKSERTPYAASVFSAGSNSADSMRSSSGPTAAASCAALSADSDGDTRLAGVVEPYGGVPATSAAASLGVAVVAWSGFAGDGFLAASESCTAASPPPGT